MLCNFCNSREADKTNSHIISKFLGKGMFGDKSNRKALRHKIGTKPYPVYDLPKESYIFCEECECKFNTIETIISIGLSKKTEEKFEFNYKINSKGNLIEPIRVSNKEILLFFYLNFLRLHFSKLEGFHDFELIKPVFNKIHQTLWNCLSTKGKDTKKLIEQSDFEYIPIVVLTTDYRVDEAHNIFTANIRDDKKMCYFVCNTFMVFLFQEVNVEVDELPSFYQYLINQELKSFHYLQNKDWEIAVKLLQSGIGGFR